MTAITHKIKWPHNQVVLRDHMTNEKRILYYHNAYGHKIWQDDNLTWAYKVTWPYNHVIL